MLESIDIFSHPKTSPGDIIALVFRIFAAEWKTFMTISLARTASFIGVSVVYGIISFFLGIGALASIYNSTSDYYYGDDNMDVATIEEKILGMRFGLLFLTLVVTIITTYINSAFQGAMIRAVANSYAGQTPSLIFYSDQSWKIFLYHAIYTGACFGITILFILIPALAFDATAMVYIFLFNLIAFIFILTSCSLIGAIPAIVVENTSAIQSFRRSWNLCVPSFCFILRNYIRFLLLYLVGIKIFFLFGIFGLGLGLERLFGFILFLVVTLAFFPLATIMEVTLYLNIRAQSESLSLSQLQGELSLSPQPTTDNKTSNYKLHGDVQVQDAVIVTDNKISNYKLHGDVQLQDAVVV